jgi:hypothetical protein
VKGYCACGPKPDGGFGLAKKPGRLKLGWQPTRRNRGAMLPGGVAVAPVQLLVTGSEKGWGTASESMSGSRSFEFGGRQGGRLTGKGCSMAAPRGGGVAILVGRRRVEGRRLTGRREAVYRRGSCGGEG